MADTIETIKKSITDKIKDGLTKEELTILRNEINCLSQEAKIELRKFVDEQIKDIQQNTKIQLNDLLNEIGSCQNLPEVQKSPETFEGLFEGTKSDMLNPEHIQALKGYILTKFEQFKNLNALQKDNLATATLDRLLSDKAFSGLFGDFSSGITGGVKSLETGGVGAVLNSVFSDKKVDSPEEVKTKVESSATGIMKRIQDIIDSATKPLVELLAKTPTPAGLDKFLGNPRSIAAYDGSGTIITDIAIMNDAEKAEYVKNLNKKVLEIDGKIISLEGLREKGMDFVATAPNWMQDIFKWLLSLPFIGNLLASFLGYKDGTEALTGMGEELRQRKSVLALKEFRTQNPDGSKHEGKYAGKIDILKGKDLLKIDRKKLDNFFAFTKERSIDATTPEFWMGALNDKKISGKSKDGKTDVIYVVEEITEKDFKDDFKGLYNKLNTLDMSEKAQETQAQKEADQKTKIEAEAKQKADIAAKATQLAEAQKAKTDMIPYKELADGLIINNQVVAKIKDFTVDDFMNGDYVNKTKALWADNGNRTKILNVLEIYARLLSSDIKVKAYIAGLKATMSGAITFQTLSYRRHDILAAAGYTGEFMKQQEGKVAEATRAQEDAKKQAEKIELIKKRDDAIANAISSAIVFPVQLPDWGNNVRGKDLGVEYPTGNISYDANSKQLHIGEKRFSVKVRPFTKGVPPFSIDVTDAKITKIQVKGDSYELLGASEKYGDGDPVLVKKTDMPDLILALLNRKTLPQFAEKMDITSV